MDHITITQLKQEAGEKVITASLDAQIQGVSTRTTKSGSPYLEVTFADAKKQFAIKIWENKPQFQMVQDLPADALVRLAGDWTQNQYGIEAVRWDIRLLTEEEIEVFLSGDPEQRELQNRDWRTIQHYTSEIADPRLRKLCALFIQKYSERFRRTAAARKNHHARRGGLVEHVAQMMRAAVAIATVYPKLNTDLLVAGVLFHDCGKMWENTYPKEGFSQPFDLEGEMLGHIPKGMEVCSELWAAMMCEPEADEWDGLFPLNEHVRVHMLHLIASHHGTYEFGSPTLPRTPEAFALHHVDNLDAKYEMFAQAYDSARELAPGIYEKQFPLPANLVEPLAHYPKEKKVESKVATQTARITQEEESFLDEAIAAKPFDGELF